MSMRASLVEAMHLPADSDTVQRINESGLAVADTGDDEPGDPRRVLRDHGRPPRARTRRTGLRRRR